jgi:hypothetical protein
LVLRVADVAASRIALATFSAQRHDRSFKSLASQPRRSLMPFFAQLPSGNHLDPPKELNMLDTMLTRPHSLVDQLQTMQRLLARRLGVDGNGKAWVLLHCPRRGP